MLAFLFGPFLTYLPLVFFAVVFLTAAFRLISYKSLVISSLAFHIFYAALLTAGQYYVWSQSEFTKLLLDSPGYFLFYSWGRFWINVLLTISAAFVFYLVLRLLKKYQERFFDEGETELGLLMALLVGWPNFAVFVPLVFVFVIPVSIFRRLFLKESYTNLAVPFFIAALVLLLWGDLLIKILNLDVLKI